MKIQQLLPGLLLTGSVSILVAQPACAQVRQVTDVRLKATPTGLEVILETANSSKPQVFTSSSAQTVIVDVSNAQLSLPSGNEFRANNPVEGIASVTVTNLNATSIQVRVTGEARTPTVKVFQSDEEGLVLSLTPASQTTKVPPPDQMPETPQTPETEPEPAQSPETSPAQPEGEGEQETEAQEQEGIEVLVTAEAEEGYQIDNATTGTRTDTPLRDVPQSIQVIPQQVLEDQQVIRLEEALRNVSGVRADDSFAGTINRINIRGFSQDVFLRDGFRESQFSLRETTNLERIEVLKGPASVLYGNLEPGGVVNLVNKKPLSEPYYSAELEVGSYGFFPTAAKLAGK